ncbi:MAG TPA: GNAT family N-acetyltransferase [Bryobacteraceae bacterium]|nr:GNAT family N-acetyltransferase [Bryobacteraceae bacterium]
MVGVARLVKLLDPGEAEFAVLVADDFQGRGLGTELSRTILQIAREEKLRLVRAEILADNPGMISVCRKLGFNTKLRMQEATMEAELVL